MTLNQLTLVQAQAGLKKKKFSSEELVNACLKRIQKVDEKIKAFLTLEAEAVLKKAKEVDKLLAKDEKISETKPLLGIPLAIKDNFCTKDLKTTAGSLVLSDYKPPYDATVVKKLKEAGAIIIGKTNLDAWAHGSSTETSQFFTTRNPWNVNFLPGGSSGGSAAAVAADEVIGAIGSETAGSIRQPAAWCGITGLKPTYGRVSRYGLIAMCSSTDSPGPLTKSVEDACLLLQIIAGYDLKDATSIKTSLPKINLAKFKNLNGLKLGLPKQYFLKELEKEINKALLSAIKIFEKLGAKIKWVDLLEPKYAVAVYTIIQRSEVSSNLARFDGIRYGQDRSFFGEEAKRRIMLGTYTLSAGYYEAYYKKAQLVRTLIMKDFERVFKEVELLLAPATPSVALPLGTTKEAAMFGELQDILFEASSLAGLPAISLPCGFGRDGLPVGLQIIGPSLKEDLILPTAYLYQQVTDWHKKKPKL